MLVLLSNLASTDQNPKWRFCDECSSNCIEYMIIEQYARASRHYAHVIFQIRDMQTIIKSVIIDGIYKPMAEIASGDV